MAAQHTRPRRSSRGQPKATSRGAKTPVAASDSPNIELVFGFVGPTGTDLAEVADTLKSQLRAMQYRVEEVRLSELITTYLGKGNDFANEYERIRTLMDRGTALREESNQAEVAARLGIAKIRALRQQLTGDVRTPASRTAYFVRSFKRPEEVDLFRQVYGQAFTLISVYASRPWRKEFLTRQIAPSLGAKRGEAEMRATELITRDYQEEGRKLGQRVGKTFPLADCFVVSESRPELERQLQRLVLLTFGHPYVSPTRDEQAMFFAKAAALRSLDLSRQVGAAIVDGSGELLGTGCNEVPRFGGGLYWGEDDDAMRDYERGGDANVDLKCEMVEDALDRMKRRPGLLDEAARQQSSAELARQALFTRCLPA